MIERLVNYEYDGVRCKQPEALRLVDALDFGDAISVKANADNAAAELRRLHAANIDCVNHFDALKADYDGLVEAQREVMAHNKRLHEVNQELLEALEEMMAEFRGYDLPYGSKAYAKAKDAILN
jgi:uncharacterized protein involved in tolerance to divalent cations